MRTLIAATMFLAGVAAVCGQPTGKFESKEGKFGAVFPQAPTASAKTAGGQTLYLVHLTADKDKSGFLVTYSDLPADAVKAPKPEQVLESSVREFTERFRAKDATKSKATTFGPKKYAAREFTTESPALTARGLLVLVGNRLYQVCVYGPKEFVEGKDADAFLASFEITQ